ncbi:hypothetical protein EIP91_004997 [Steccherinum ochraceum]|uniref:Fungal-type protein kinase domain-containing protein n=1 Tax=Steccherinum ochraceum TaxID=92696 RepID=A0A4R0RAF1_9APHY|nr:hypothetical protein EIP91_004997 [Steccherinum ochraceum]
MASTPPHSATSAEAAARAAITPLTGRHPDRQKGLANIRNHLDAGMTREDRYVEVTWKDFMKEYVPITSRKFDKKTAKMDLKNFQASGKTLTPSDEKACYPSACRFITTAIKNGRLVCKDIADWPDKSLMNLNEKDSRRADLALYKKSDHDGWSDPKISSDTIRILGRRAYAARNSIAYAAVLGEVKLRCSGFSVKKGEPLLVTAEGAERTRGQMADYVTEILTRQHRTFVFTFYIYRKTARILRWDRVGCVVCEVIDLETEPEKFFEFFFRIALASDSELGLDPTATALPLKKKELDKDRSYRALQKALKSLPTKSRLSAYIKQAFEGDLWPLYKLDVPNKDDQTSMGSFLVRNLTASSNSPTGRATKGFIAYDLQEKSFCFLKDSWATRSDDVHPELDVYKRLEPHKIPGIATVRCGGDLPMTPGGDDLQETRTQDWEGADDYLPRVHTRIVLNEIGIPLKDYSDSKELCSAVSVAFAAHFRAWTQAKILHRDVSDGNIVIDVDLKSGELLGGLLIDWDLCKYQEELENGPTQKNRSGTWRYLSALLLNYPKKGNDVSDDIESFLHLLCIFALRFHENYHSPDGLRTTLSVYDECRFVDGYWVGAWAKLDSMLEGKLPLKFKDEDSEFYKLLTTLFQICRTHYSSLNWVDLAQYALPGSQEARDRAGIPRPAASATKSQAAAVLDDVFGDSDTPSDASQSVEPPKLPPVVPTGKRALDDHIAFGKALRAALKSDGWTQDKSQVDNFSLIEWKTEVANSYSRAESRKRAVERLYGSSSLTGQPDPDRPQESASKRKR